MNTIVTAPIISRNAINVMKTHGGETYPYECCGALLGRTENGFSVVDAFPLSNSTDEGPRRRFLITPDDYIRAERRASDLGLQLVGFYHSHPDHPAQPSQYDLERAWPNFLYVIASTENGVATDIRCWRLDEDRSRFVETGIDRGSDGGLEGCG